MMVTFVSQCEKKALKKTRRVLDAFANRIGDNTWQTLITEEGLNTAKKMLRKTASKSTAVSCHWIRSRSRSQLLWIVGNKSKFNEEGVVPVNSTRRNLLKTEWENDWHYLPLIKSLTAVAALLHDWGKASTLFQEKLQPSSKNTFKGDPIRHEWISLLLFRALVFSTDTQNDQAWLEKLSQAEIDETLLQNALKIPDAYPLRDMPPIAQWVAWLIVSHHRLPCLISLDDCKTFQGDSAQSMSQMLDRIDQSWSYENRKEDYEQRLAGCFRFPHGLLSGAKKWQQQLRRWAKQLLEHQDQAKRCMASQSERVVLSYARLCVMLGDHYYSSQDAANDWRDDLGLYANTKTLTNKNGRTETALKQKLDEHLVGVAHHAVQIAHLLPAFESEPPVIEQVQVLRKPSPKGYQWQDKAVQRIHQWQAEQEKGHGKQGFFAVNMASTGCGKTFANAKIMRALSDDQKSLRFILALGLRTLTLQTGREYRQRIGLDDSELAVLIGSKAVMELDQRNILQQEYQATEACGSGSQESLLKGEVEFDCAIPNDKLVTVLRQHRDKQFLYAPVLACTIDHLMSATETKRGGRYILPTLRLMSSDLVIDEIDDFTGDDLIAIGRLIHLAGMLGRKVMISSATIPPYMAEGYFNAYREGWALYAKTRDAQNIIGCAWVDEFDTQVVSVASSSIRESNPIYRQQHADFIAKRVAALEAQPARRKALIANCEDVRSPFRQPEQKLNELILTKQQGYFERVFEQAWSLHKNQYQKDDVTGLKVSFGVVRMANIRPCVALAHYLLERDYPDSIEVRVMAYHSQQVLLLRSEQEAHLDTVLNRKVPEKVLQNAVIRDHLNQIHKQQPNVKNVLFILVATPVEEVGRDHDLDWAVVEPSSYRSIVQLAGRVKRHRSDAVSKPNMALMQYNWKAIEYAHDETKPVFQHPGFETTALYLKAHNLDDLLDERAVLERLDAIPRIQQPSYLAAKYIRDLREAKSLAELEHMATWRWLANYKSTGIGAQTGPEALLGWLTQWWYLTALPQRLTPFRHSEPTLQAFLVYDAKRQESRFCEKDSEGYAVDRENELKIERYDLNDQAMQRLWLIRDFEQSCANLAEEMALSQRIISLRYGELGFRFDEKQRYFYNDQLGLVRG